MSHLKNYQQFLNIIKYPNNIWIACLSPLTKQQLDFPNQYSNKVHTVQLADTCFNLFKAVGSPISLFFSPMPIYVMKKLGRLSYRVSNSLNSTYWIPLAQVDFLFVCFELDLSF